MFPVYHITNNASKIISSQHKLISHSIPTHWHDCMEVELVLAGSGTHTINGIRHEIKPGDLYLLTPLDHHGLELQEPLEVYGIMFTETLVSDRLRKHMLALAAQGGPLFSHLTTADAVRVRQLFELADQNSHATSEAPFFHSYTGNILGCILIELARSLGDHVKSTDRSAIQDAIVYMSQHYTEPVSLEGLAGSVHLNPSYLSRLFHQTTGLSFSQYLIDLRLRHAGRLLATSKLPVAEVCFTSGFHDYAHFTRSFKKHFGISPTQFRQLNNPPKEAHP